MEENITYLFVNLALLYVKFCDIMNHCPRLHWINITHAHMYGLGELRMLLYCKKYKLVSFQIYSVSGIGTGNTTSNVMMMTENEFTNKFM